MIDLKGGQVVRGVGGHRDQYAPVKSRLTVGSTPKTVAQALAGMLGTTEVYVADLDAIGGGQPDWESIDQIAACGIRIWLDCGISSVQVAQGLDQTVRLRPYLSAVVVGLESIQVGADLPAIIAAIQHQHAVFSLDLKQGRPLTSAPDLADHSPLELAQFAWRSGFQRMIVLDLAYVGTNRGVGVAELCQQIRALAPAMEILAGGGVRTTADIRLLANAGCNGVLLASALHSGEILPRHLAESPGYGPSL